MSVRFGEVKMLSFGFHLPTSLLSVAFVDFICLKLKFLAHFYWSQCPSGYQRVSSGSTRLCHQSRCPALWRACCPPLLSKCYLVLDYQPPPPNTGFWLGEGTTDAMSKCRVAVPRFLDNLEVTRSHCNSEQPLCPPRKWNCCKSRRAIRKCSN